MQLAYLVYRMKIDINVLVLKPFPPFCGKQTSILSLWPHFDEVVMFLQSALNEAVTLQLAGAYKKLEYNIHRM